jgi:hypothetical protein
MDVNKILTALRQERTQIEEVIVNLELLAVTRERRRGRPPAILAAARKRGRPKGSKNRPSLSRAKAAIASMVERPVLAMAAGQAAVAEQTGS